MELWTQDGLAQTWELAHAYVDEGEAFPRHMSLAFGWNTGVSAEVPVLRCSLSGTENRGVSWTGPVAEVPRIGKDFMVSTLAQATAAEPELGVVAVCFSLDPSGQGLWQNPDCLGILAAPSVEAGKAFLLLRMTFT